LHCNWAQTTRRSAKIPIAMREVISIPRKLYQQLLARSEKIFSFWIYRFSTKTSNKDQFTIHIVLLDNICYCLSKTINILFFLQLQEKEKILIKWFFYTLCITCYVKVCATIIMLMVHTYTLFTRPDFCRSYTFDILRPFDILTQYKNSNKY